MLTKRITLTALIALVVSLTAASSVMTQQGELLREEFHQTYPLSADGRVSLENINGAVRVTAWDRNEVQVDAVKTAYRRDRLDEAKIEVRSDGNSIHIQTDYPERSQNFTNGQGRENNPATVEYTLSVPRGARLDSIELINGNMDIDGLTGSVKASSINGRVTARGLTGATKLSTINGNLEAAFDHLDQASPINVGSVNGNVILTIPSDSQAQLKASTVHGSIRNDFGLPVRHGEYVGNDLAGQLGQGGVMIKLGNVNGGINIRHAADGRPLSSATNLLAEQVKDKDADNDNDNDMDDERNEARRAARDAAREASRAQREAARATAEAQREAQRAKIEAQRAAQVEGQRAQVDAQRQAAIEAQRARVEASRTMSEADREAIREAARVRVDTQRISREVSREVSRAVRVEGDWNNSLRLVEREVKNFTVSGMPRLNLQTFDGYISVHAWDKQEVQLTISKRAANEQSMNGIHINADQNSSEIKVVADFDAKGQSGENYSTNAMASFDVYVPRNANIQLSSGDGRLELEGVSGTLDLNTGDGRIEVRDAAGHLTAKTGDGRIEVENFKGGVNANTGDGRINLDGRFEQLMAKTGDGSIVLVLPADFNAIIETDAESVDNEAGLTLTEEPGASRRLKRWKIGQGGPVLTLRTGEGHIILQRSGQ
ncbi:MAG TPA: DUF4097 family beta strand repeat-containing protein [Pyrinomonadaceae bacterium]